MTKLDSQQIIERYERGALTDDETMTLLVASIGDDPNAWPILSDRWKDRLTENVRRAPHTDDEWSSMRVIHAGSWTSQSTFDESERRNKKLVARYRVGINAIRDIIGLG